MRIAGSLAGSAGVSPAPETPMAASVAKPESKQLKDLKKACEQFEAVFAKKLFSEMRKGVNEVKIGDSAGSEIYKDMMDQAVADSMAKQGALGIGKMLYKQFEKQVAGIGEDPVFTEGSARQQVPERPAGDLEQPLSHARMQTAKNPALLQGPIPTIPTSTKR